MFKQSKMIFRLYQTEQSRFESSFFDLIDGNLETKQTKGLAYLFNLSPEMLRGFLMLNKIDSQMKKRLNKKDYKQFLKSDFIKIDAEMMGDGVEKVRRDITLTFYNKGIKTFVLIIEAKSIKLGKNFNMENQLQKYIHPKHFPEDANVAKMVVALTKNEQIFEDTQYISITWTEVIQVLFQVMKAELDSTKSRILKDYYKFITGVDKAMHFYEKEILSVPAGKTFNEITNHHIHACPLSYNYRDSLFITFRQKGGIMDKLYKIEHILELDPSNHSIHQIVRDRGLPYEQRLLSYLKDRIAGYGFTHDEQYRFYILSEEEYISLPHKPHPEKNNVGPRYYTLAELLSGREIVYTEK